VLVVSHKATLRLLLSKLARLRQRGYRDGSTMPACLKSWISRMLCARLMLFTSVAYQNRRALGGQPVTLWDHRRLGATGVRARGDASSEREDIVHVGFKGLPWNAAGFKAVRRGRVSQHQRAVPGSRAIRCRSSASSFSAGERGCAAPLQSRARSRPGDAVSSSGLRITWLGHSTC